MLAVADRDAVTPAMMRITLPFRRTTPRIRVVLDNMM